MSAPTHSTISTQLVRPVDALERLFYRYAERKPTHFCIAAGFDVRLTEAQLRTALLAVQKRHPLLSVPPRRQARVLPQRSRRADRFDGA